MKTAACRKDFPFFHHTDIIYLDSAATSQKPQVVLDAMNTYYTHYCANTHRGAHDLGNKATQEFEHARTNIAAFMGAQSNEIIFTRGATEAINLVASSFVSGNFGTVLLSHLEHHSNILPWQLHGLHLELIPMDKELNIDLQGYEELLKKHPNSFVAITHIANSFGIIHPVKQMIELAHQYECTVLVDGAQALAHLPIDVKELDADFYAISAHKAYGPTGIGALYGKYEHLQNMPPYQGGGSMIKDVQLLESTFLDPPLRFEAGTQAIAEAIGFSKAVDYLKELEDIQEHDAMLIHYAKDALQELKGVKLYTDASNVSGNISFTLENIHHNDISILLSKQNIMLRTGHHCALPIMRELGIEGTIRLSFAAYTTQEDIDLTITALHKAIKMLS